MKIKIVLIILIYFFPTHAVFAQEETKDLKDVIGKWKKDTLKILSPELQIGKNYLSILPVVGYAPANGFLIGAAVSITRLVAKPPTNLSSGMLNFQLTSKKQFIINARSKIYLAENKWFLQGDWRILFFAQPTYGLGINYNEGNKFLIHVNGLETEETPVEEPMRFNYVRIYEDVVHKIGASKWYAGAGIAFDLHYSISDQKLNLDADTAPLYITNHYAYSVLKGFSTEEYSTNGFNANILTDHRDNIANPYKGYYASLSFRFNSELLGSSKESTMLLYDLRYYLGLSKQRPRHVLAFWSYGNFVTGGEVPYLALPSIGWDTYNRSGRGYIQGRYRGLNMVYAEAEYRFPISKNGFWGGVAFVNTTFAKGIDYNEETQAFSEQKLFEKAAPGMGAGIRMKMDKRARINLTVDLGYGTDNSSGIYFNLQEVF
ncbi:MAG: BamA/TamA family outer membrane protein [Bacteroidia bacterium]